jgi:hypothetical protein
LPLAATLPIDANETLAEITTVTINVKICIHKDSCAICEFMCNLRIMLVVNLIMSFCFLVFLQERRELNNLLANTSRY